jgi:putative transposase
MPVSKSTMCRVLADEHLVLSGHPPRDLIPRKPWPDWLEWKPNRIWADDFTHFTRTHRAAIAILDVVCLTLLTTLVTAEESFTQVAAAFTAVLSDQGCSMPPTATAATRYAPH